MDNNKINELVDALRDRIKPLRDILLADLHLGYPDMTNEFGVLLSWAEDDKLTVDIVVGNTDDALSIWETGGITGAGSTGSESLAECLGRLEKNALHRAALLLKEKKYE